MVHMRAPYDPVARKRYYEEHKHLKGRQKGSAPPSTGGRPVRSIRSAPSLHSATNQAASQKRVAAIRDRLSKLRTALQAALKAAQARESSSTTQTKSDTTKSTTPTTAKEKADARAASKKYRDTHKQEIAAKRKAISDMTVDELRSAIKTAEANLRAAVQQARNQTAPTGR